ncbi:HAMP domain-containing sensor histidine kinase [Paenibacillus eucommiae]|uniref:histidine kinase n=1 Tax=Paenibacillus eucommiae TaxID=1355755 RepID=A0ABS4IWD4_9BACL|nr:HAMP domain-containing sensor histidine kinase [Paenibacillus eucommiae]MBP1991875.1 signal transduction histidine kinase [Paenibacillus eucommiae]
MPNQTPKRSTLLRYWTLRYVLTLSVGLLIIGAASVLWLKHTALNERLDNIKSFSLEAADYVTSDTGQIVIPNQFYEWIDLNQRTYKLPGQFGLTVFNQSDRPMFYKAPPSSNSPIASDVTFGSDQAFPAPPPLVPDVIVNKIGSYYTIISPIRGQNSLIGTIAISYAKKELTDIGQQYGLISVLLLLSGLLGWLILYLLLRKLSKPIDDVVHALKRVESGNYGLLLQDNVKEQEIYDLLVYFNAMAARLEQLEQLRTELLAGVTHELKTPVTSIRGLIRTVRDKVVTSNEADEFLDISLKETQRLEQMVSDLLDFNAFASGKISFQSEAVDLGKLLAEIVYQWNLIYQDDDLEMATVIPDHQLIAIGDASRIQQIIVNLLNNSWQAISGHGIITVTLTEYSSTLYEVQVKDNGSGIPPDEQINIFERYYRGTNKKHSVRGLGLGLTYSRMLANMMNGMLNLKESSATGTTFQLMLPKASSQQKGREGIGTTLSG